MVYHHICIGCVSEGHLSDVHYQGCASHSNCCAIEMRVRRAAIILVLDWYWLRVRRASQRCPAAAIIKPACSTFCLCYRSGCFEQKCEPAQDQRWSTYFHSFTLRQMNLSSDSSQSLPQYHTLVLEGTQEVNVHHTRSRLSWAVLTCQVFLLQLIMK